MKILTCKYILWLFNLILINLKLGGTYYSSINDIENISKYTNIPENRFKWYKNEDVVTKYSNNIDNTQNKSANFLNISKNELHKLSKYWLKRLGIPKEIPPSAWCNDQGVVVGIPITSGISKMLNERVKTLFNREIPIINEDWLENEKEKLKEGTQTELLSSKGIAISCNGSVLIAESFYEIKGNKRMDSLMISIKKIKDCDLFYEYRTDKYNYRVYKIDPFDKRLWLKKDKFKFLKEARQGNNIRVAGRYNMNVIEVEDDKWNFELPSNLSIIVVCICKTDQEEILESQPICYPNVKWQKTVRGHLIDSDSNKYKDNKYIVESELRDATMYGMLLSTLFTAGYNNEISVPNDEKEHIFDNKLDFKYNSEYDLDYLKKIYLWPNYCEYSILDNTKRNDNNEIKVKMVKSKRRINNMNNTDKDQSKIIILSGCPTEGIKLNILLNIGAHLIFSIYNQNWNDVEFNRNSNVSLKCAVKMYDNKQDLEKQGCIFPFSTSSSSSSSFSWPSSTSSSAPISSFSRSSLSSSSSPISFSLWSSSNSSSSPTSSSSWLSPNSSSSPLSSSLWSSPSFSWSSSSSSWSPATESLSSISNSPHNLNKKFEAIDQSDVGWTNKKWDDYLVPQVRKLIAQEQLRFNPHLRQHETNNVSPNTIGMRSQLTGKSIMNTPKIGRESLEGGSGDKSYLFFNRQFEEEKNINNLSEEESLLSTMDTNIYRRSLPSERMISAVFQNILWRDWLIRYAPLVGGNGNFIRVGKNFAFGFIGESYIEEAATLGLSYDRAILSFLSGKRLSQLGRFVTLGYTQGLYGVRVDRSATINAWGLDLQARYFISSTLASFGLREYAQHITVRNVGLSLRHSFSQGDLIVGQEFSTEAIASYKTLFVDIATNVKYKKYGMALGLRGYQFTIIRDFSSRSTDFLGNWGNGWQLLLSSTFPTDKNPTVSVRAGAGRLGRSFVLGGAGVGKDMIPIVSFQTQLDDVGVILEFSPTTKDRIFAYGIEINRFAYFWESVFSTERTPVPLILGVEPKDLSKVVFGSYS